MEKPIDSLVCPNCEQPGMRPFHEVRQVPVHSVLLVESRQTALDFPRRDIRLAFCPQCGFISNVIFDPTVHQYSERYEETQGFSATFNAFHARLAGQLIERYNLREKTVLEIGCGKGEFLALLCEMGDNRGIGVDPAYVPGRLDEPAAGQVTFIRDFYSDKYIGLKADFYCCKMTLEHIPDTANFLRTVRGGVGDHHHAVVFFQIPEVTRILCETAFWDIYYEHCSYFSRGSLARLFRHCGFEVRDVWTDYDDQYLMIEARPGNSPESDPLPQEESLSELERDISFFTNHYPERLRVWRERLAGYQREGRKVVLWGSGSKGVSFLTTLGVSEAIGYCVDINPHKQGTFMPGTGHEIVSPEFLTGYCPDVVILMNPVYQEEVRRDLDRLNLSPEIVSINA